MTSTTTQQNGTESQNKYVKRKSGKKMNNTNNSRRINNKKSKNKKGIKGKQIKNTTFKGDNEEMKGHVFQLRSESNSLLQFTKTQEQLVRYVTSHCKRSLDIKWMVKHLEEKVFSEPVEPTNIINTKVKERVFEKMIDAYMAKQSQYDEDKSKVWEVVWDQCSKAMKAKLEGEAKFPEWMKTNDCVHLLKCIKKFMYQHDNSDYEPLSMFSAKWNAMKCKQGRWESTNNYYTRFKGVIEVLEYYQCSNSTDIGMVHYAMKICHEEVDTDIHVPGNEEYDTTSK